MQGIVGREAELEAVERFLGVVRERAAGLVIEGEAGIGKTTVWLEAVRLAEALGFRVLRARPSESEAKLSYAALTDLIGAAFDETRSELPSPQQRALDAALLRADVDERTDPRTIATALVSVLTALAAEGPVVIAIDDVQWLDRASERALEYLARRPPGRVGMLFTRRTANPAPPSLDRSLPEGALERLVLGPLSLAALHHLIKDQLGIAPARPTLVRVAAAAGGNPFFALEIARALERDVGKRALGDPLPVPERHNELVAVRVHRLSTAAQQCLLVASALSRPTVPTLAAALRARSDPPAALIEAEEAGILVADGARIRFAHPLHASAVYGSASPLRRRQLHRRLADIVTDAEERARHLALSTIEPNDTSAGVIELAADGAAQRGAQDAAAELFAASVRLTPPDRLDDMVRRMFGEAAASFAAGDLAGARSLADRAVVTSQGGRSRIEGLLLLAHIAWVDGTANAATEYLEEGLAEPGVDRALLGRIHAKLATYHMNPERVIRHADAAIQLLDEEHQPGLVAQVLIQKFYSQAVLGLGAQHDLLQRGLAMEKEAGMSAERSVLPLIWLKSMDDFDAARARWRLEDEWYRERGQEGWRADRLAHLAEVELRAGNWALAERYIEESCDAIDQVATRGPWAMPLRIRASIDAHRGRTERAYATLEPLIEEAERASDHYWAGTLLFTFGFVALTAGDDGAVDRALTRMAEHFDSIGMRDHPNDRSQPDHIEALVALGEPERARLVLAWLEERGRKLPRLWISATLPRCRALVLAAEGKVVQALDTLETAPEVAGLPFELARTLLVKGRLHRRVKHKRQAADALQQALEIFDRLGAPTWAERAGRELGRVGLRPASPSELTQTERRVAELAAVGHTNREVAQELFMSPKTVEANLARVYRKLAIKSRAELGARMGAREAAAQT
jgi:DNA-binding CsgD family transcriptional regulator